MLCALCFSKELVKKTHKMPEKCKTMADLQISKNKLFTVFSVQTHYIHVVEIFLSFFKLK